MAIKGLVLLHLWCKQEAVTWNHYWQRAKCLQCNLLKENWTLVHKARNGVTLTWYLSKRKSMTTGVWMPNLVKIVAMTYIIMWILSCMHLIQMSKHSMILVTLKTKLRSNLSHAIKGLVIMHLGCLCQVSTPNGYWFMDICVSHWL